MTYPPSCKTGTSDPRLVPRWLASSWGDVNPSGRLPFTFPVALEDVPAHKLGEYTGERRRDTVDIKYNESIFVGYRWADKQKKVKAALPLRPRPDVHHL